MRSSMLGGAWPIMLLGTVFLLETPNRAAAEDETQACDPDGQAVAYGDVVAGCTIEVPADLDIFTFAGSVGEDVAIIVSRTSNLGNLACVEVRNPDASVLAAQTCSSTSVRLDLGPLTQSGMHQIAVTEQNNDGTFLFNLSIERVEPPRSPTPVAAGDTIVDRQILPASDLDAFAYNATAGDVLRLIVTRTSNLGNLVCVEVRGPGNAVVYGINCGSVAIDVTLPPAAASGTYQVLVSEQNNDGVFTYNLSLNCFSGGCASPPPTCLVDPSVTGSTLRLDFTVGTSEASNLYLGLAALGSVYPLIPTTPLPVISPTVSGPLEIPGFPNIGTVGIFLSLTTDSGLYCWDFKTVDTGAAALVQEDLKPLLEKRLRQR